LAGTALDTGKASVPWAAHMNIAFECLRKARNRKKQSIFPQNASQELENVIRKKKNPLDQAWQRQRRENVIQVFRMGPAHPAALFGGLLQAPLRGRIPITFCLSLTSPLGGTR
jgi:hypothetical protein